MTKLSIEQQKTEQATLLSASVNVTLSILQIITGWLSQSQGLIADGIHTLSDLISDFVVLIANRKSHRSADKDHPFGHARYQNAASLALGIILMLVGGGMLYSAITKMMNISIITTVHPAALWVAMLVLVTKETLFRYIRHIARKINSSMLEANAWHARSDAASSLIIAIGIIGNLSGFPIFDPLAAMLIGLLILRIGSSISWSALNILMDKAMPEDQIEVIRQTILKTPGVLGIHDLRTRRMGDSAFVDVHIEVAPRISMTEGHYIAVEAQRHVKEQHNILDVLVHIDPPNEDDSIQQGLLQRPAIESAIVPVMHQFEQQNWYCTLHYLDNLVEIVVVLSQSVAKEESQKILKNIHAALNNDRTRIKLLLKL